MSWNIITSLTFLSWVIQRQAMGWIWLATGRSTSQLTPALVPTEIMCPHDTCCSSGDPYMLNTYAFT